MEQLTATCSEIRRICPPSQNTLPEPISSGKLCGFGKPCSGGTLPGGGKRLEGFAMPCDFFIFSGLSTDISFYSTYAAAQQQIPREHSEGQRRYSLFCLRWEAEKEAVIAKEVPWYSLPFCIPSGRFSEIFGFPPAHVPSGSGGKRCRSAM